ncbi:MAG: hypothetical protein AMJ69_04040 [Gammaproteobacteria bacterium SG8_47]|nr:MAG: hypothetical protein AMJ69_04040 [Gammaproteobacteria bacterium SG8_47]
MSAMGAPALLSTLGLDVRIGACQVCKGFEWSASAGECWGILGRNGTGKTTLLHTLAGLHQPSAGHVCVAGADMAGLPRRAVAQRVGLLPQEHSDPFPGDVLSTVLAGRHPHLRPWQWETATDVGIAQAALARVDLDGFGDRRINSLSGGERRRVGIATLLAQAPDVYLLDEPLNHLDPHHQIAALDLLRQECRQADSTVVMSLHDVNLAARYCDRILFLFGDGETAAGEATQMLTSEYLEQLFAHPMEAIRGGTTTVFMPR